MVERRIIEVEVRGDDAIRMLDEIERRLQRLGEAASRAGAGAAAATGAGGTAAPTGSFTGAGATAATGGAVGAPFAGPGLRAGPTGGDVARLGERAFEQAVGQITQSAIDAASRGITRSAALPTGVPQQPLLPPTSGGAGEAATRGSSARPGIIDLSGMGGGIVSNMYERLWQSVLRGETAEAGAPSALLQLAQAARARGGVTSQEQFQQLAREYSALRASGVTGAAFQVGMQRLVSQFSPGGTLPTPGPSGSAATAPLRDTDEGILADPETRSARMRREASERARAILGGPPNEAEARFQRERAESAARAASPERQAFSAATEQQRVAAAGRVFARRSAAAPGDPENVVTPEELGAEILAAGGGAGAGGGGLGGGVGRGGRSRGRGGGGLLGGGAGITSQVEKFEFDFWTEYFRRSFPFFLAQMGLQFGLAPVYQANVAAQQAGLAFGGVPSPSYIAARQQQTEQMARLGQQALAQQGQITGFQAAVAGAAADLGLGGALPWAAAAGQALAGAAGIATVALPFIGAFQTRGVQRALYQQTTGVAPPPDVWSRLGQRLGPALPFLAGGALVGGAAALGLGGQAISEQLIQQTGGAARAQEFLAGGGGAGLPVSALMALQQAGQLAPTPLVPTFPPGPAGMIMRRRVAEQRRIEAGEGGVVEAEQEILQRTQADVGFRQQQFGLNLAREQMGVARRRFDEDIAFRQRRLQVNITRGQEDIDRAFQQRLEDIQIGVRRQREDVGIQRRIQERELTIGGGEAHEDVELGFRRGLTDIAVGMIGGPAAAFVRLGLGRRRGHEDIERQLGRARAGLGRRAGDVEEAIGLGEGRAVEDADLAARRASLGLALGGGRAAADLQEEVRIAQGRFQEEQKIQAQLIELRQTELNFHVLYNKQLELTGAQQIAAIQRFTGAWESAAQQVLALFDSGP